MPQVSDKAAGEETAAAWERVIGHFFLLGEETKAAASYETQVESELSYEAILAREAADENYVDSETGEVVLTGETPEATGSAGGDAVQNAGETQPMEVQPQEQPAVETGTGLPGRRPKQVTYAEKS